MLLDRFRSTSLARSIVLALCGRRSDGACVPALRLPRCEDAGSGLVVQACFHACVVEVALFGSRS
jgi:hypothetical protein